MGLLFRDLDTSTRPLMIEEIEIDLASAGGIYRSNYLHDEE